MLLALHVPRFGAMTEGSIQRTLIVPGTPIVAGAKLLEIWVSLAAAFAQNCAPEFAFRVVALESGWLRRWSASPGEIVAAGAVIALVTTTPDEAIDGCEIARPLRVSCGAVPCV
ncbi:MAG: hypothetical protein ACRELY_21480 [Polyangiaceae bacterium]